MKVSWDIIYEPNNQTNKGREKSNKNQKIF